MTLDVYRGRKTTMQQQQQRSDKIPPTPQFTDKADLFLQNQPVQYNIGVGTGGVSVVGP